MIYTRCSKNPITPSPTLHNVRFLVWCSQVPSSWKVVFSRSHPPPGKFAMPSINTIYLFYMLIICIQIT